MNCNCSVLDAGVQSVYLWEGKVTEDSELILMIKTRTGLVERLTTWVLAPLFSLQERKDNKSGNNACSEGSAASSCSDLYPCENLCRARLDDFCAQVKHHHPFEECEVISVPITGGSQSYLAWIKASTEDA